MQMLKKFVREFGRDRIDSPLCSNHSSCLSFAAYRGRLEVMRWLIKSRAAVDPPSDDPHNRFGGYFPLANACRRGNIECVKLLLEHRASTTRKTRLGKTATELAVISEHHDCAMLIVEHEQKLQEEHEVYQRAEEALNEAILHATREGATKLPQLEAALEQHADTIGEGHYTLKQARRQCDALPSCVSAVARFYPTLATSR